MTNAPVRNIVYSHFPSFLKIFFVSFKNSLIVGGSSVFFGTFMQNRIIKKVIKLSTEIAKKGRNHNEIANAAPIIGLKTFPKVLEVSTIPRTELALSSSLKRSPTKGKIIGKAPDDPIPWIILPIMITVKGFSIFQEANAETKPPINAKVKLGSKIIFLPNRSDRYPAIGISRMEAME